ncbi:hypothetical protein [Flavobacterium sp. CF136]|uniref:hypothetical protein n=1 Tax=Flavobacterium sp. (strain CF136) TaxID=1144313 RepID=UPI0002715B3A|nr:hypothetical protein [Flavobacterium sp. CF136]EJL62000.1 hypothetical protein PMI10_03092 [Flavobacterium sp. CF136]
MSRIRTVGGTITKTTKRAHHMYSEGSIVFNSGKTITEVGEENGVVFGEPKTPPLLKTKEKVVSISSELYMHNNQELKIPYLDVSNILNYESSKPFIAGIRLIFGRDIKHTAAKKLMKDLIGNKLILPKFEVEDKLSIFQGGYYHDGVISINQKLILDSEKEPEKAWLLFRVIMEEIGHYIDDLLRNKYDNIGGDDPKDEGVLFTADFIKFNQLLLKDFEFAKVKIQSQDGSIREFSPKVLFEKPNIEEKAKELLFVASKEDDHGIVTLKSGKKIEVEFFKIRGAGAIHESITKKAAIAAGIKYDFRLDEGCAWPDVPCEDENSIETCYYNTWDTQHTKGTKAYDSHHGTKQYWHSMAPIGNHTNQEIIELIILQAKIWFKKALETKVDNGFFNSGDDGLFHIGKILHMVQDSYSLSHVQRDSNNRIIQFQGYEDQDEDKHGTPDKNDKAKGVQDAIVASTWILSAYKQAKSYVNLKAEVFLPLIDKYLRTEVYPLAPNRGGVKAGGSLDAYKKIEEKKQLPKEKK